MPKNQEKLGKPSSLDSEWFLRDEKIKKLLSLGLPSEDYTIFGSGPLFAHKIVKEINDLDVVARGLAWEKAARVGEIKKDLYSDNVIIFFDGLITIFDGWSIGDWSVDELIDTSDIIAGIRFVQLEKVLIQKRKMNREKDIKHIRLLEEFLKSQSA